MSKTTDINDILGDDVVTAPSKKAAKPKAAPAKKAAKPAAEAKAAPAKKAAKPAAEAVTKTPSKKEPMNFEEGERQSLADAVTAHFKRSKKAINSRDLAVKLETETRKLRVVLYALVKKGVVSLEAGESKVAGMTVTPA